MFKPPLSFFNRQPLAKADGGFIAPQINPLQVNPTQVNTPQINLPTIDQSKFATPYTGISPNYQPPPPPPPPPPAPPVDWIRSQFTSRKDAPMGYEDWKKWFETTIPTAPQEVQDWYKTVPTDKEGFITTLKPLLFQETNRTGNQGTSLYNNALGDLSKRVNDIFGFNVSNIQNDGKFPDKNYQYAKGGSVSPLAAMKKR